jgi:uncharacterized damage-inducible protein DinB
MLGCKSFWLRLWLGATVEEVLRGEADWAEGFFPDSAALEARWSAEDRDLQRFLDGLTDEGLAKRMAFEFEPGKRWEFSVAHILQHVVNHSTYHRGQVATLLRQLGQAPPATDLLEFLK